MDPAGPEGEGLLSTLLDLTGDPLVLVDPDGRVLAVSGAARRLGLTSGVDLAHGPEAWGLRMPDRVTEFPAEELPLTPALRGEPAPPREAWLQNAGAVPLGVSVELAARPWFDHAGRLRGGVMAIRERGGARGEPEPGQADLFLESVVENIPDMLFIKEATELRFERFNRAGEELLGIQRARLMGKNDYDFFPREQADFFTKRDREALEKGEMIEIPEEPIDTPAGRRWLRTKKVPLRDAQGRPRWLLGISSDITTRKLAEDARRAAEESMRRALAELEQRVEDRTAELRRANEELTHANEGLRGAQQRLVAWERTLAMGEMANGIAHDFNNFLSPILGFSGLLLEGAVSPETQLTYLRTIHDAALAAAHVVSRLRGFYRGRDATDDLVDVDLSKVVQEVLGLTRPRWKDQAEAAGLRIVVNTRDAPGTLVLGNLAELREMLTNLVLNAVDALPRGGTIELSTGREGDHVTLEVSDTGTGMTEDVRRRCLEPFFTTKGSHGTGLGLAQVHGTVRRHGGSIEVCSEPGQGSKFMIRLPASERRASRADAQAPAARRTGRILVVDDQPEIRDFLGACLSVEGHVIDGVQDGAEALKRLGAARYDLVITDMAMPGMSGDQLALAVSRSYPELPVIMLTGFANLLDRRPTGIDLVLGKPVTPTALRHAVEDLLRERTS